ncbi:hypothetical protein ABFX02_05G020300 [Erythranthe guttata]
MEKEGVININKGNMKVEIPAEGQVLTRQGSMTKHNCLCSPTTHVGSFRCRLHRLPSLNRTKSIDHDSAKVVTNRAVDAHQL